MSIDHLVFLSQQSLPSKVTWLGLGLGLGLGPVAAVQVTWLGLTQGQGYLVSIGLLVSFVMYQRNTR